MGKTAVTAAACRALEAAGHDVTAASIGDAQLGDLLGVAATDFAEVVGVPSPGMRFVHLDPQEALSSYLDDNGLMALGRRMSRTGMLELVATSTPGIKELLILGQLRQLESSEHTGTVVVDGPAAGHALALLRAPAAMAGLARSGRLRDQAESGLELLRDGTRCQVVLVTLPEHTPVSETVETAFELEDQIGVKLGPIVVNRCAAPAPAPVPPTSSLWPELDPEVARLVDRALGEDHARHLAERDNVEVLTDRLGIRTIELPDVSRAGRVDLDALTTALDRRP